MSKGRQVVGVKSFAMYRALEVSRLCVFLELVALDGFDHAREYAFCVFINDRRRLREHHPVADWNVAAAARLSTSSERFQCPYGGLRHRRRFAAQVRNRLDAFCRTPQF